MNDLYEKLMKHLKNQDKAMALELCMTALDTGEVGIVELYEEILAKALNSVINEYNTDVEELIWKEHVRSGIIRTIVESAYPYVLKEKSKIGAQQLDSVIVMCPEFEDHELGARMIADFFAIAGYKATFIGAKTPQKTLIKAIEILKPKYISISVTNHYNLVGAKETIENIKNKTKNDSIFLLGGNAFLTDPTMYKKVGGDQLLKTFKDIVSLNKDVIEG